MAVVTNPFVYGKSCSVPAVPGAAAVEIEHLSFNYLGDDRPVLDDISLRITPGERVALIGPNGAGKSTLIRLIAGLEQAQAGDLHIYGNPVGACHHRVGYVPQRGDVDWRFPVTVRDVVMMGRYTHLGWLKRPRKADHEAVDGALDKLNILDLAERQIGALSGGQQQRVMIARTLAQDADLLLLDEPLNNLDVPSQEVIFHTIAALAETGRTMIISTHDVGMLPAHFSRAIFLDRRIVADGPADKVLTPEVLSAAYGMALCIDDEVEHTHAVDPALN